MMNGHIFGDLIFSLARKHIMSWWDRFQPLLYLSGCGSQGREIITNIFWLLLRDCLNCMNILRRKKYTWTHTIVLFVWKMWRRPWSIFSSNALLAKHVGFFCGNFPCRLWRNLFGSSIFREIIIVASWAIWTHRNRLFFMMPWHALPDGKELSLRRCH